MSYHIYNTRALILISHSSRERDKTLWLLTQDFGLIRGTVRGIRSTSSRLGSILLDYALINVSLVKGKNVWRVTTAALLKDSATLLKNKKESLKALARILDLIQKLVRGEDKNEPLFLDIQDSLNFLLENDEVQIEGWEILSVLRLLYHLGYLSKMEVSSSILEDRYSAELLTEVIKDKKKFIALANSGIRESGLS
jgi:DNA repair protein RecO